MNDYIKTIREACIKAGIHIFIYSCADCHEIYEKETKDCIQCKTKESVQEMERSLHLADILYAYQYLTGGLHMGINQAGNFMFSDSCTPAKGQYVFTMADYPIIALRDATKGAQWNLKKDRLEDQSEECLKFLAELLK